MNDHNASDAIRSGTVVLVDDHEDTRELMLEVLALHGFSVRGASDAETALVAIQEDCPDVVVSDLHLGRVSGVDLARKLRALQNRAPSLVAVTGDVDALESDRALWDEVLQKPVDPNQLASRLAALVRARRASSGAAAEVHVRATGH